MESTFDFGVITVNFASIASVSTEITTTVIAIKLFIDAIFISSVAITTIIVVIAKISVAEGSRN